MENNCNINNDDCKPDYVYNTYEYFDIKYDCSLECFKYKLKEFSSCPTKYDRQGERWKIDDDKYGSEKVCYRDNINKLNILISSIFYIF